MGRKRKIPVISEEKENTCEESIQQDPSGVTSNTSELHGPMFTIMSNVQRSEALHKRYIKEMKQLYSQMNHDAFLYTFIKMIKVAMEADETNEYAHITMLFCAKFISSYDGEDTHPLLMDTCKWLLSTISYNPHIRLRLCQFVNMILNALGQEAALDDAICDRIMEYMMAEIRDVAPSVRVQAILAMQRLQVPDNPDDPVVRVYQFHLASDPSPKVRQTVITCIGRNYNTIPYILERLWDIDEKVRRHTYLHMSSYPVRSYKVRQRLMLIEQGLNDRSDIVRKVVINILLQQWLESYDRNLISLTAALKLDANECELDRFRKAGKQMLDEIFKNQSKEELVALLPIVEDEDDEFHHCVPHEKLNIEVAFYWQCLSSYLQEEMAEEVDKILPELSTFSAYVLKYCETYATKTDPFEVMESQFILLSLLETACTYDLGDEIGRENLQKCITNILKHHSLNERVIRVIVKCAESLITDQNARLHYMSEILQEICCLNVKQNPLVHDRSLINELLSDSSDRDLNLKLTSLKLKILDLEEQENDCWQRKKYNQANKYTEEKNLVIDEYTKLLQPLLDNYKGTETISVLSKEVKNDIVVKGLQIIYYMVVSEQVNSLNPSASKLYSDFICRHIASNNISARDWALKCGTAYSMLYEPNAKEVFDELYAQFFRNHNIRLWETSINCIFELIDRYSLNKFCMPKAKKTNGVGRQLYNTIEQLDMEEEPSNPMSQLGQDVDVVYLMSHFLDTCHDVCIIKSIITGFCRLVLRGHIKNGEILEKLLLCYFNPSTDNEINQTLGVFLETLFIQRKHHLLEPCLMPTVNAIFSASYDSPLRDIRPETIMRFIMDATMPECCPNSEVIHNRLASSFLQEMINNVSNKELCKLLSKEIVNLRISVNMQKTMKADLKQIIDKLLESELESRTAKYLREFRNKLDGVVVDISRQNSANQAANDSNDDEEDIATATGELTAENDAASLTTATTITPAITQSSLELPPLPPLLPLQHSAISPPDKGTTETTATPNTSTTYGRDNNVQHRSLRKSLNTSLSSKATPLNVVSDNVGPSRPAKIRIEARIDSDKSPSTPTSNKSSGTLDTTTYNRTPLAVNSRKNLTKSVTNKNVESPTPADLNRRDKRLSQKTINNSGTKRLGRPPNKSANRTATTTATDSPEVTMKNKNLRSRTMSNTRNKETHAASMLNTSDIIPASPTAATPRSTRQVNSSVKRSAPKRNVRQNAKSVEVRMTRLKNKDKAKATEDNHETRISKSLRTSKTNTTLTSRTSALGERQKQKQLTKNVQQKQYEKIKRKVTSVQIKNTTISPVTRRQNKAATMTPTRLNATVESTRITRGSSITPRRSLHNTPPVKRNRLGNSSEAAKRPGTPSVDKLRESLNENTTSTAATATTTPNTQNHDAAKRPRPASTPVKTPVRTKTVTTKIPRLTKNINSSNNTISRNEDILIMAEKRNINLRQNKIAHGNKRNLRATSTTQNSRLPLKLSRK